MRRLVLMLLGLLPLAGCTKLDGTGYTDCWHLGGESWTRVLDDPHNCGGCGIACVAGVPCVERECRMDSPMHCGTAGRSCLDSENGGREMACVRFGEGDAGAPEGVELVGGFGCVPVESGDAGVGDAGEVAGAPKRSDPRWLTIPGHTAACADGLETNGCVTGEVAVPALCGEAVPEPFAYDFAIMTGEMSRGQFRELMCDCGRPAFSQCARLCEEARLPDAEARAARPMTGLNWCEAYTACQRMGARLPTLRERLRLEALVEAPPTLFEEPLRCAAWAEETGRVPWLAECLDAPAGELALDDVKGESGQLFVSGGALRAPEPVHHLIDNVGEWLADPMDVLSSAGSSDGGRAWGLPVGGAAVAQPRLVRGRSLFSPAGQPGGRLIAVEPSVSAEDLGVRCARTTSSPFDAPVPYDAALAPEEYAVCEEEPVGWRPARQSVGEQIYRASGVCIDSGRDLPDAFRQVLEERARWLFIDGQHFGQLARRALAGQLLEVGLARFAMDEQWWLTEPAGQPGQPVETLAGDIPVRLTWQGEEAPLTSACLGMQATDPTSSETYGRIVRRHEFVLGRGDTWMLGPGGAASACSWLACSVPDVAPAECEERCPGWVLPFAFEFQRVEPSSPLARCR